ncbi:MAG: hypothetical protein N2D54_11350, partial [Chloroflexota bacterium]
MTLKIASDMMRRRRYIMTDKIEESSNKNSNSGDSLEKNEPGPNVFSDQIIRFITPIVTILLIGGVIFG